MYLGQYKSWLETFRLSLIFSYINFKYITVKSSVNKKKPCAKITKVNFKKPTCISEKISPTDFYFQRRKSHIQKEEPLPTIKVEQL